MGLFFTKGVLEVVVKIHLQTVSNNSILKLKLWIWRYWQVTTVAFRFTDKKIKRNISIFMVLAVFQQMK